MSDKKKYTFLDLKTVNEPFIPMINDAVRRVVDSGRYIGGQEVEKFECSLAESCDTTHGDACTVGRGGEGFDFSE